MRSRESTSTVLVLLVQVQVSYYCIEVKKFNSNVLHTNNALLQSTPSKVYGGGNEQLS
jgi:hypothetical protein